MSRKNMKKSPVGMRVAALIGDGYYAPATIESVKTNGFGTEDTYIVKFDDVTSRECSAEDMIGTNFQTVSNIHMQRFQKVYTTHNGREVSGYIQRYQGNHVLISIPGTTEEKEIISKKPEEIRLLDSRKSQRLQRTSPMDYRKMSGEGSPCKRRTVSDSIKVPQPGSRIRRTSEEPTMNELMAAMVLSNLSSSPVFYNHDNAKESSPHSFGSSGVGSWTQDSRHTSPSRQPTTKASPQSSARLNASPVRSTSRERPRSERELSPISSTLEDVLDPDSGMVLLHRSTPTKTNVEKKAEDMDTSDEPQDLSVPKVHVERVSSPNPLPFHQSQKSSSLSEAVKLEVVMEQEEQRIKPEQNQIPLAIPLALPHQLPLSYYFTPGFLQQHFPASLPAEFRVQLASSPLRSRSPESGSSAPGHMDSKLHRHLHRTAPYKQVIDDSSAPSPSGGSSPSTMTFGSAPSNYYHFPTAPIPVASLSFSPAHHSKHPRSPLASKPQTSSYSSTSPKVHSTPIAVPSTVSGYSVLRDSSYPNAMATQQAAGPNAKAFSWHSGGASTSFMPKPIGHQRQPAHPGNSSKTAFPISAKNIPMGRKVRGDGKKCRKVYGMENKDLWCTACRWKKACQRFPD